MRSLGPSAPINRRVVGIGKISRNGVHGTLSFRVLSSVDPTENSVRIRNGLRHSHRPTGPTVNVGRTYVVSSPLVSLGP